jgi:hypothetical protein
VSTFGPSMLRSMTCSCVERGRNEYEIDMAKPNCDKCDGSGYLRVAKTTPAKPIDELERQMQVCSVELQRARRRLWLAERRFAEAKERLAREERDVAFCKEQLQERYDDVAEAVHAWDDSLGGTRQ